jgi:hypothetical protein
MKHAASAAVAIVTASVAVSAAWSQTSVIQQNSVSINGDSTSVTVSGDTVTVETSRSGRVVGDGQRASETRAIAPVTAVDADGAFAITIRTGTAPGLTIETDKNLLPIVKTEVSSGRLDLYADKSYSVDGRIKVTITSPNVSEISASGSNRIDADGLTGGPLSISLNGSNHATLSGGVSTLTAHLSGSNQLAAEQLAADSVNVTVSGSGNAAVDARQQVAAEVSGAGSISIHGNPKARSTQVNGAGKITFE